MTEPRPRSLPARLSARIAAPAAVLVLALAQLPALEVIGDPPPPYLAEKLRADWRMTPLAGVLDQIAKQIEKPLARTKDVLAAGGRAVVQVDERKVPLREALELLERAQGLRFTAEALRLRVETDQDFRDRRRRPVNLSLRDFASNLGVRDFPGPELAFAAGSRGNGGGFDLYAAAPAKTEAGPSPEDVIDRLKAAAGGGDVELRGGNVYLLVTPEEEQAMRVELQRQYDRVTRRSTWRATFGTIAGDGAIAGGVVSAADGAALAKKLAEAQRLDVAGLSGQRVHAAAVKGQAYVADSVVVNDRIDPTVEVLRLGRVLDVRPTLGLERDLLSYRLRWADEAAPPRTTEVRHPDPPQKPALGGTVKLEKKDGDKQEGTVVPDAPAERTGGGVVIQEPEVWTWQPRGDVFLARDQALVLVSVHPAGRAVIVVERLP
jgi:hypothetical protein